MKKIKTKTKKDTNVIVNKAPQRPAWRPTKYGEEVLNKAYEYLQLEMPFKGDDGIMEVVHTIEGFSLHIKVSRETVYDWCKDDTKKEFSDIVKKVMAKQAKGLVTGGLSEKFSSSISKVMLTKHGYRDSSENIIREVPIDPEAKEKADGVIDEFLNNK